MNFEEKRKICKEIAIKYLTYTGQKGVENAMNYINTLQDAKHLKVAKAKLMEIQKKYPQTSDMETIIKYISKEIYDMMMENAEDASNRALRVFVDEEKTGKMPEAKKKALEEYERDLKRGGSKIYDLRTGRTKFVGWMAEKENAVRNEVNKAFKKNKFNIKKNTADLQEILGKTFEECERIARTESARINDMVDKAVYKTEGVKHVQIIAGTDERTCPICKKEHGRVYELEKAPHLPLHPNCRCIAVPYDDEEFDELEKLVKDIDEAKDVDVKRK